jgi:hypothetical protein
MEMNNKECEKTKILLDEFYINKHNYFLKKYTKLFNESNNIINNKNKIIDFINDNVIKGKENIYMFKSNSRDNILFYSNTIEIFGNKQTSLFFGDKINKDEIDFYSKKQCKHFYGFVEKLNVDNDWGYNIIDNCYYFDKEDGGPNFKIKI